MKKHRRALEQLAQRTHTLNDLAHLFVAAHFSTQERLDRIMATLKQVQDDLALTTGAIGQLVTLADEDHDELVALRNAGGASAADLDAVLADSQAKRATILADLTRNAPSVDVPTGGTSTGGDTGATTGGDTGAAAGDGSGSAAPAPTDPSSTT